MNIVPSDNWKLVLFLVLIVIGMTFFGVMGLADADILNQTTADSIARQRDTQTALDAARGQMELNDRQRQLDADFANEQQLQDMNLRKVASLAALEVDIQCWTSIAFLFFKLMAGCAALFVLTYGLLVATHRLVDRALPRRLPEAPAHPRPPADPWQDAAFRQRMRRRARQAEREWRREQVRRQAIRQRVSENGHGVYGHHSSRQPEQDSIR